MAIDEKRRARLVRAAAQGATKRSSLVARALAGMTAERDVSVDLDPARIAIRRSPSSAMGPNLIIKLDNEEIGRFLMEPRILEVPRRYRASVHAHLRSLGEDPRPSLPSLPLPRLVNRRYNYYSDLLEFSIPAHAFGGGDSKDPTERRVGVVRVQRGVGIAIAPELQDLMRHRAAELGFAVDRFLAADEVVGQIQFSAVEHLNWRPKDLLPNPAYRAPSTERRLDAAAAYLDMIPSGGTANRNEWTVPRRALQQSVTTALPAQVVSALEEAWEYDRTHRERPRGREWTLGTGQTGSSLSSAQVEQLKRFTPALALPEGFPEAAAAVLRVAPAQSPFLLALELREKYPKWWKDLPWTDLNEASRFHGGPAASFEHVARGVVEESKHAALIRLISRDWMLVDWPAGLGLNEQMRAWTAIGALGHADFLVVDRDLEAKNCTLCGARFHAGTLRLSTVKFTGTEDLCWPCGWGALNGLPGPWTETRERAMVPALKALAEEVGTAPSLPLLRLGLADSVTDRAAALALRSVLPGQGAGHPRGRWLEWLEASGVLDGGWRPSRGIISTANDGHHCRSMFERHVDDFFSRNQIPHECEPTWPYHPTFNPTGRRRADWLLPGGVHVEAAGFMARADYAAKMAHKVALAKDLGVELIVLAPTDVGELDRIFSRWLEA